MISGSRSRKKVGKLHKSDAMATDLEGQTEIHGLFNKIKTYRKPSGAEWCVPDANVALRHPPEKHGRLQALKASLNDVKNRLSDKNVQVWHQHTNSTNRAGKVMAGVRSAANAELCTQAWCKFYEILGTFNLLPAAALQSGELNTVHLCEAPGAFIAALNHYLKTTESTRYCDWSWVANTLNPYHEANGGGTTIADDRLIANTLPWWFFGSDNTGDIMTQTYLLELQAFVAHMRGGVHVVTADGSFDCQENPDEQEALVAPLHYCEAAAALLMLGPGGSLVLKMFTLYEHSSVCLLYLLNCCFASVSVFKPATSKSGNSEVYVVCLTYDGRDAARPLISKLLRRYGPRLAHGEALFPSDAIPESFRKQHEEVCLYFHALQVETITENLRLFEDAGDERRRRLDAVRDAVVQEYLRRFQVSYLPRSRWVSRNAVTPACFALSAGRPPNQKNQAGSFNERRELSSLSWRDRVEPGCRAWIQTHRSEAAGADCLLEGPLATCRTGSWYLIVGPALPAVRNSPFCEGGLLNRLNEALTEADVDWSRLAPCGSCSVAGAAAILSDVAGFCDPPGTGRRCLVFGSRSAWSPCEADLGNFALTFSAAPSFPQRGAAAAALHDGDPRYQRQLFGCLVSSLQTLKPGDALLLPVLSALTRVTAAAVLCLHACFRSVTFRCPPPCGAVGALLLAAGFCPEAAAGLFPFLPDLLDHMVGLEGEASPLPPPSPSPPGIKQVLQFVPMEEMLSRGLTEFLRTLNAEIIRQKLHLLMLA